MLEHLFKDSVSSCSSRRLLDVGAAATSFEASAAAAADLINDDLRLMDHCESRLRRCLHFHTLLNASAGGSDVSVDAVPACA